MQADQVKALLESQIADSEVQVNIDGSHFNIVVVSPVFDGLNAVKKQQLVYGALSEQIASGVIHAVNMKTFTPAEWQAQQD